MALEFDIGTQNKVVVGNVGGLHLTIACWVKTSYSDANNRPLINKGYTSHTAPYYQYFLYVAANTGVAGGNVTVGGTLYNLEGGSAISDGIWHSVVLTYDGETIRLYRDTTEVASNSNPSGNISQYATDAHIAGFTNLSGSAYSFTGLIDDMRIYNRALSVAEIQAIYRLRGSDNIVHGLVGRWMLNEKHDGATATVASSIIDISGQGNHGTPYNSPVYRESVLRKRGGMSILVLY